MKIGLLFVVVAVQEFFGLKPARFQGHVGYADFLQSYTEPAFIPHNGSPLTARDFVDEATSSVTVLLVFFTWELGTTTVVRLDADLDGVQEVQLQYTVNHFVVLEGHQLTRVLVVLVSLHHPDRSPSSCPACPLRTFSEYRFPFQWLEDCLPIGDTVSSYMYLQDVQAPVDASELPK